MDGKIKARDQRSTNDNSEYHYFLNLATKERTNSDHLPHDSQICDIKELPLSTFLLSENDLDALRHNMAVLLLRNVVHKINFLEPYKKYVPSHITHQYSDKMSQKSSVVNLGIVFAGESSYEGMTEIMEFIHSYIPKDNKEQLIFGGDQLTVERACGVQRLRKTAINKENRLSGVLPTAEDWHTMMTLLIVLL